MTHRVLIPDEVQGLIVPDGVPVLLLPRPARLRPSAFILSIALHVAFGTGSWFLSSLTPLPPAELHDPKPREIQYTRIIALLPPKLTYPTPPAPQSQTPATPQTPRKTISAKLPEPPRIAASAPPPGVFPVIPGGAPEAAPPPVQKPKAQPFQTLPVMAAKSPVTAEDLLIQADVPNLPSANARAPEMLLVNEVLNKRRSFIRPPDAPRQPKAPANMQMDIEAPRLGTDPAGSLARANTPRALLNLPPAARFPVTVPQADTPPQNIATVGGTGADLPTIISIPAQAVPRFDQNVLPSTQTSPKAAAASTTFATGAGGGGINGAPGAAGTGAANTSNGNAEGKGNGVPTGPGRGPVAPAMPTAEKALVRIEMPKSGRYDVAIANTESHIPGASGLLKGRPVYTVYISTGTAKDWVLQYAASDAAVGSRPRNSTVVTLEAAPPAPLQAPYAQVVLRPPVVLFASDGRYAFVHGTINTNGRFEGLQVVGSTRVADAAELLRSLSMWEFRPATKDGVAVAVEVLLCIPNIPG